MTTVAIVVLIVAFVGAVAVSGLRSTHPLYRPLLACMTLSGATCVVLDVLAWMHGERRAALALLLTAAVLMLLGWQQSRRLSRELDDARRRLRQQRRSSRHDRGT